MAALKRSFLIFGLILLGVVGVMLFTKYYWFFFSRRVVGVVVRVERIQLDIAMMQAQDPRLKINPQLFSFAVAIKERSGEIVTASTEDRQWAVVQEGQCAEAVYYPYPPWNFEKANTYYGARLERLFDCKGQMPDKFPAPGEVPPSEPASSSEK